MEINPPFIYALFDPKEPDLIRYIGLTTVNSNRPRRHEFEAMKSDNLSSKVIWILRLISEGRSYGVRILQQFPEDTDSAVVAAAEFAHIRDAKSAGHPLTNIHSGGGLGNKRSRIQQGEKLCVRLMSAVTIAEADEIYKRSSLQGLTVSQYIRQALITHHAKVIS